MPNLTDKFASLVASFNAFWAGIPAAITSIDTKLNGIVAIAADVAEIKASAALTSQLVSASYDILDSMQNVWTTTRNNTLSTANTLAVINTRDVLMLTAQQSLVSAIGSETAGTNTTLLNSQTALRNALNQYIITFGGVMAPDNLTAMQLLAQSLSSGCGCPGSGPSPDAAQTCEEPFFSTGIIQIPLVADVTELRSFASWTDAVLPLGFSLSNDFSLPESDLELLSSDWSNWWVYVDSDAATFSDSANPTWPVYKATRQWHPNEAGAYANVYHVPAGSSIKVYLCEYAELPTVCTTYDADVFIGGKQAYLVPPVGGLWTVQADDNFYVVNAANVELEGPLSAGAVHARASLPAGTIYLRMGTDFGTAPQRTVILCPPAEL